MGAVERLDGAVCLVTGGLGFIGSNTALALAAAGAEVRVLDALIPEHGGDLRNVEEWKPSSGLSIVIGDISDDHTVAGLLDGVDVVFNIAGQVSHHESMVDPLRDLDINVRRQLLFLESIRRHRPDVTVVHTSTRQVFGRPRYQPVDEEHPAVPRDINGVDKLAGEFYHRLYGTVHDIRTVSLRLTNVYGPRQDLRKTGLGFLPVFASRVLRGLDLEVFGDGAQRRDCLHVDDVIDAMCLSAMAVRDGAVDAGEYFNIGHERSLSLLEIAHEMARLADTGSSVRCVPWPDDLARIDIGDFAGDYTKAESVLKWRAAIDFTTGMRGTLDFYRSNPWYL